MRRTKRCGGLKGVRNVNEVIRRGAEASRQFFVDRREHMPRPLSIRAGDKHPCEPCGTHQQITVTVTTR